MTHESQTKKDHDMNTQTNTAPSVGHNNPPALLTQTEIEEIAGKIGELLASAEANEDKADNTRDRARACQQEADEVLFPALDTIFGYGDESERSQFNASKAKTSHPQYEALRIAICTEISRRLKDAIVTQKPGKDGAPKAPKFSQRVAKQYSRRVVNYRTGGKSGEQTDADKAAREAEKVRKESYKMMSGALADIIKCAVGGDTDGLNAQIKAACSRWPVATHDRLFPRKGDAAGGAG